MKLIKKFNITESQMLVRPFAKPPKLGSLILSNLLLLKSQPIVNGPLFLFNNINNSTEVNKVQQKEGELEISRPGPALGNSRSTVGAVAPGYCRTGNASSAEDTIH